MKQKKKMGFKNWLKGSRLAEMVDEAKVVKKVDRAKRSKELEKNLEEEATPLVEELGIPLKEAMLYVQAKKRKEKVAEKMEQMKKGLGKFQDFCDMRVEPPKTFMSQKGGKKDGKEVK